MPVALLLLVAAVPADADPASAGFALFGLNTMTLVLVSLALLLGGFVKGAIGVGLPVVAIAVLSNFLPIPLLLAIVAMRRPRCCRGSHAFLDSSVSPSARPCVSTLTSRRSPNCCYCSYLLSA